MRWIRPLLWTLAVLALLVGGYAAAGHWWAPHLIKTKLPEIVAETTGQKLTLGVVVVKPFALSVDARDIVVTEPNGSALVAVKRLFADLELESIWRRGVVLRELRIERPAANAVLRADGTLNLVQAFSPKTPAPEPSDADDELFRISIADIAIVDGVVDAADLRRADPVREHIEPINVRLRDFTTMAGGQGSFRLAGRATSGESLALRGRFKLRPFELSGGLAATGIPLRKLWEIGGRYERIAAPAGRLGLQTGYRIASTSQGLSVTLDALDVGVDAVAVRPPDAESDWLTLTRVDAKGASVDVIAQRVTIPQLTLSGVSVDAWLDSNGEVNFARLAPDESAAPSTPVPEAPSEADEPTWIISAPRIRVVDARVKFEDRSVATPVQFALTPLEVDVDGFASEAKTLDVALRSGINDAGTLDVSGQWAPDTSEGRFEVELASVAIAFLQPYLESSTDVVLKSGKVGTSGRLALALPEDQPARIEFDGDFSLADFRSIDRPLREDFIKFGALQLSGIRYRSDRPSLRIREAVARKSYFKLVIAPDSTTNIQQVLSPPRLASTTKATATTPSSPAATEKSLQARIDRVRFVDGSANFADLSIRPSFATGIQQLEGTVTGLSSDPGSRAEVTLDGKVDRYAPVEIRGQINYLAATSFTNVTADFQNIELPTFTPYSGKFMGYAIEKGKLNANFRYKVEDRKLDARHKFVIDQLTLGDRIASKDATRLPVKLAIALLKDRNGVIDIDLPVTGSLDDPKFRLGPIIWKVFVNLLVKIVTAPFALIGSLFGGGEEVRYVDFQFGSFAVDDAAKARLANVGKALADRPQLKLEVPLVFDAERDGAAIADQRFGELVAVAMTAEAPRGVTDAAALEAEDTGKYLDVLDAAWREATGEKRAARPERAKGEDKAAWELRSIEAVEAALRAHAPVTQADLENLAKARADSVRDAVIQPSGIDPARVFITKPGAKATQTNEADAAQTNEADAAPAAAPAALASGKGVRLALGLE